MCVPDTIPLTRLICFKSVNTVFFQNRSPKDVANYDEGPGIKQGLLKTLFVKAISINHISLSSLKSEKPYILHSKIVEIAPLL